MKRLLVQGGLLLLSGIANIVFGQNQTEKTAISQNINQDKLHNIIQKNEKENLFQRSEVARLIRNGYEEFIEGDDGTFSQLIGTNELGAPIYLQTMNQNVVNTLGTNILHSGFDGFNLTGLGMIIGLWEPKSPRLPHQILGNTRITYAAGQLSGVDRHATHIAGTLIGKQTNVSSPNQENVQGVAFESKIKAYDWNLAASEMATEALAGLLVANTSFGYAPAPLDTVNYGRYSAYSQEWDAVMCAAPYLQIVKPAGNVRDDSPVVVPQVNAKQGFDLLESSGTSKNVLVVSAFDLTKDEPSESNPVYNINLVEVPYSSWGPTDDGRIKPDITAHGHSVYSSIESSNSAYGLLSGTSMATAGVSGAITLLQQYYKEKFGHLFDPFEVPYLWSSSIRGLIIHTADEVGEAGPDYKYGWGVMNAVSAAEIISQRGKSTIIREENLKNGEEFKLNIVSNGYQPLIVTLAWTDPEGEVTLPAVIDDITHKLVNDLDIRLIRLDSNGNESAITVNGNNILYPWKRLDGITNDVNLLNAPATRGINNVDNIEKIEIPVEHLPQDGGVFRIEITHKGELENTCVSSGQNFSLIVSGVSFCEDEIILYQNQDNILTEYEEGLHLKADYITASNIIEPVANQNSDENLVEYEAYSKIDLIPQGNSGFTADYGSNFYAHIDCDLEFMGAFSKREIDSMLKNPIADQTIPMIENIVVYPNPVINNFLNVQFELTEKSPIQILLYDLQGKIVQDIPLQNFEKGKHKQVIDLSRHPKGVYIIKVITSEKMHTQKLIKK
ncbi:S8 family serine peptidase [Moheibacter sediminis]|uniref:Por secretion system C-terminal sorting domain-containing protein n=1 Tax=Moheibacter sediminis TaxID=1434700 RepID=A0A1W1ZCQ2_9FLAO|nr:S8 family serine peptidase [Moheibacter sediminis]SMC46116.1 Por secretion system C-terminal sorting domain-containing protein [Moheibacter sediminis]